MKIEKIEKIGKTPVYDITVKDVHHYMLANGVVTHNTSLTYSSNQIFVISKAQEKDKEGDLDGWKFTINIHKSRTVREKSKFPFVVKYDGGIQKYSGLLDIGLELGFVVKPSNGWFSQVDMETGEINAKKWRRDDTDTIEFWGPILKDKLVQSKLESAYMMGVTSIMSDMDIDDALEEVE